MQGEIFLNERKLILLNLKVIVCFPASLKIISVGRHSSSFCADGACGKVM